MTGRDSVFAGSIPALYDRYLGPLLFAPYARDLAGRLADLRSGDVLETAAGTGIVTEALAERLAPAVRQVATDLNQAMVDHASTKPALKRVTLRPADALALPFADGSFDAVVCQFGAMFFPDKAAGYREARRVLRPGGRFVFNIWDSLDRNPMTRCVVDAMAVRYPQDPPRFLARTPHGHADVSAIRRDLAAAGFDAPTIETVTLPAHRPPTMPRSVFARAPRCAPRSRRSIPPGSLPRPMPPPPPCARPTAPGRSRLRCRRW